MSDYLPAGCTDEMIEAIHGEPEPYDCVECGKTVYCDDNDSDEAREIALCQECYEEAAL